MANCSGRRIALGWSATACCCTSCPISYLMRLASNVSPRCDWTVLSVHLPGCTLIALAATGSRAEERATVDRPFALSSEQDQTRQISRSSVAENGNINDEWASRLDPPLDRSFGSVVCSLAGPWCPFVVTPAFRTLSAIVVIVSRSTLTPSAN